MERTVIFYHKDCPDGFGGAYGAWKKFGDAAEYRGVDYGKPLPDDLTGAQVYFIDVCFPQEQMDAVKAVAAHLTVLDHHEGVEEITKSMPEFVFDSNRSGATIAWSYFHPSEPVPELLTYVEDDDLFRFALPETRPMITYLTARPYSFEAWDQAAHALTDENMRAELLATAHAYAEYFELLAAVAVEKAKLVRFEGVECYFATAHPLKPMKSLVGNLLVKMQGPFALVVTAHPKGYGISIRGDGTVDVSAIAQKYGGNGHPNSAGFGIPAGATLPWEMIDSEESAK